MTKEVLKLALEALELHGKQYPHMVKGYCLDAIAAIKKALAQPEQEPVAYGMWDTMIGCGGRMMYVRLDKGQDGCTVPLYTHPLVPTAQPEQEPVRLRRGNILRCIETNELCTVWSTSTTGKTLVKWGANSFGEYTAEQIGELFWLEPEPDNLELAAEKSDNYASFHAGYRFAVAHHLAQPEREPVAWWNDTGTHIDLNVSGRGTPLYTHPVKDLEDININITWNENSMRDFGKDELNFARAILRKAQEK